MAVIKARDTLDDVHLIGGRQPADGIAEPGGIRILGTGVSVGENLTPDVSAAFIDNDRQARVLNDAEGIGIVVMRGTPGGRQRASGSSRESLLLRSL